MTDVLAGPDVAPAPMTRWTTVQPLWGADTAPTIPAGILDGEARAAENGDLQVVRELVGFLRARLRECATQSAGWGPGARQHRQLAASHIILSMGEQLLAPQQPSVAGEHSPRFVRECLQHVAAVYQAHAGYRQQWRP